MIICLVQICFAFVSRFSGASFFDSLSIMSYNLFYTSLIGGFFIFEQDLSSSTLLSRPALYRTSREGQNYTNKTLLLWFTRSVYQSMVISVITYTTSLGTTAALTDNNQFAIALIAYSSIVLVQCFTLYIEMSYITILNHGIIWLTVVAFFVINIFASFSYSGEGDGVFVAILRDPIYWLSVLLGVVTCLLPVIGAKSVWKAYSPSPVDIAHEEEVRQAQNRRAASSDAEHLAEVLAPSYASGEGRSTLLSPSAPSNLPGLRAPLLEMMEDQHYDAAAIPVAGGGGGGERGGSPRERRQEREWVP